MSMFKKATKAQLKARIGLVGPTGSGKTYTALLMAKAFVADGGRVAVIDTERGSASKYSGEVAEFDVCELENFAPSNYIEAIKFADAEGYDVIVIDSLSHAWMGEGGALDMVDKASKRSQGGSFAAWRDVTPECNALVDCILQSRAHVIVTLRSKMEYAMEKDDKGRTSVRKIGLAPVQRAGLEYEFDIVGEMDVNHNIIVSKSRCSALADAVINKPGAAFVESILAWLSDGEERTVDRLARELRSLPDDGDALKAWTIENREHRDDLRSIAGRLKSKAGDCGVDWSRVGAWIKDGDTEAQQQDETARLAAVVNEETKEESEAA